MLGQLPMKSMIRRPSLSLPDGLLKNTSPYGHRMGSKAAEMAPVSEFESPKLKTTGKSQSGEANAKVTCKTKNANTTFAGNSISVPQMLPTAVFEIQEEGFSNFAMCLVCFTLIHHFHRVRASHLPLSLSLHYLLRRSAAMARASAVPRE